MTARRLRKMRAAARARAKTAGAVAATGAVLGGAWCATRCDDGPLREVSKAVTGNKVEPISFGPVATTDATTIAASGVFLEVADE